VVWLRFQPAMELDDLLDLVRVAEAPRRGPPRPKSIRPPKRMGSSADSGPGRLPTAPPAAIADAGPDRELAELEELSQLAEARLVHKRPARSWQAAEHARNQKSIQTANAKKDAAEMRADRAEALLRHIGEHFPVVGQLYSLPARRAPFDVARAAVLQRTAFLPTARDGNLRRAQARAASLVATAGIQLQRAAVDGLWAGRLGTNEPDDPAGNGHRVRVNALCWQWDETTQKLRAAISANVLPGEKTSSGSVSKQVMMQGGLFTKFSSDRLQETWTQEPFFCRALVLESLTAKAMLEGMSRLMPVPFDDPGVIRHVASQSDFFIWSFCCDRASANFAALHSVWAHLAKPAVPRNLLPFVEPCAAHGVALVRGRSAAAKDIVAVSHTLAACFRQWRFAQAFRDALLSVVRSEIKVRREMRPAVVEHRARQMLELLFGGEGDDYLFRVAADGSRVPTAFYTDLLAVADVIDLGALPADWWIHWCYVVEGSPEHAAGASIGSACCVSEDAAVEKLAIPLLNVLLHRQWSQSDVARWTYVGQTLRKIALGMLAHRVLPKALAEMQALWGVHLGLEGMLERLVAAHTEDFRSGQKLRLLRCCKVLVPMTAAWQIGVQITVLAATDLLLYSVLGDGIAKRADLADFVDEENSPVAHLEARLSLLLLVWGPHAPDWQLFVGLGGDVLDDSARKWARQTVLQTASATFDVFEQRMSHPPFTLFKLDDARLPADVRHAVAKDFTEYPKHCLSLFCLRLREQFPTTSELLQQGPAVMRALALSTSISIDGTERSHTQLRLDVRSTGKAANFTTAANRVWCQQLRSEHERRSGTDPAKVPFDGSLSMPLVDGGADVDRPAKRRKGGGNPRFEWQNFKLKQHKLRLARTLTQDELDDFYLTCDRQWAEAGPEERQAWADIWKTKPAPEGRLVAHPKEAEQAFKKVWALDEASRFLPVPAAAMVELHRQKSSHERRALAQHDADLLVLSSCVDRTCAPSEKDSDQFCSLFGCRAAKKNVCRHTLGEDIRRSVDAICWLLNRYVDSLPAATARNCDQLLLLEAAGPGAADSSKHTVVVLADFKLNPKYQILGRCTLQGQDGLYYNFPDDPCTATVSLARRGCGLASAFEVLDLVTSDSLALDLASRCSVWRLCPLQWRFPESTQNLLDMVVTSRGPEFEVPKVTRKTRRCGAQATLDVLNAAVVGDLGGSGFVDVDVVEAGPSAPKRFSDVHIEGLDLEDLPPDLARDVLEEHLAQHFAVEITTAFAETGGAEAVVVDEVDDDRGSSCDEVELSNAVREEQAAPAEATLDDVCEAAIISTRGYVTSPVGPWGSMSMVGRLTTWPEKVAMDNRSCSMKCYVHPGCTSPARKRHRVTDAALLRWLFSGELPAEGGTSIEKKALGLAHRALFQKMVDNAGPAAAASSTSGARSSVDPPAA
jgi:hypothetical protein